MFFTDSCYCSCICSLHHTCAKTQSLHLLLWYCLLVIMIYQRTHTHHLYTLILLYFKCEWSAFLLFYSLFHILICSTLWWIQNYCKNISENDAYNFMQKQSFTVNEWRTDFFRVHDYSIIHHMSKTREFNATSIYIKTTNNPKSFFSVVA